MRISVNTPAQDQIFSIGREAVSPHVIHLSVPTKFRVKIYVLSLVHRESFFTGITIAKPAVQALSQPLLSLMKTSVNTLARIQSIYTGKGHAILPVITHLTLPL